MAWVIPSATNLSMCRRMVSSYSFIPGISGKRIWYSGMPMLSACSISNSSRTPCMDMRFMASLTVVTRYFISRSGFCRQWYSARALSLPPLQLNMHFLYLTDFVYDLADYFFALFCILLISSKIRSLQPLLILAAAFPSYL